METTASSSSSSPSPSTINNLTSNTRYENLTSDQKLDLIFSFNHLTRSTKNVLIKVYTTLAINLMVASFGVMFSMFVWRPHIMLQILFSFGGIVALIFTKHNPNTIQRFGILNLVTFVVGISSSDMINLYIEINPSIVLNSFICTIGIFITFTMFSLFTNKRQIIFYGSLIFSLSLFNITLILSRFFIQDYSFGFINQLISSIVLLISVLFIIYDTQLMIYKIENLGDKDFISHSLILFLDFLELFRIILSIFGDKDSKKKSKK